MYRFGRARTRIVIKRSPLRSTHGAIEFSEVRMRLSRALVLGLLALLANISIAGTWIAPPAGSPVGLMQRLDRAKWIATGAKSSERVVYVFTDADCPYCNDLWKAMQTARAADVQIRYLMVAVIDADSKGKAAEILESKD